MGEFFRCFWLLVLVPEQLAELDGTRAHPHPGRGPGRLP
jgi:hypothetical protein